MTNRLGEELMLATLEKYWPFGTNINTNTIQTAKQQFKYNSNTNTIATKITNVAMTSNVNLKLDQYSTMLAHIISPCFKIYSLRHGKTSPRNVLSLPLSSP